MGAGDGGAGGGGGGGGGGVAPALLALFRPLPGLTAGLTLPRLLNEKYEAARCSSGLLGLAAPELIEPDLGVFGVEAPMPGIWKPMRRDQPCIWSTDALVEWELSDGVGDSMLDGPVVVVAADGSTNGISR